MKIFDENGEEIEGKEFYDEDGKHIGTFIEDTKENIEDAFETSWLLGILLLILAPVWGILYIILMLIFKLIAFIIRLLWWIIRTPFCLIFKKEFPKFK